MGVYCHGNLYFNISVILVINFPSTAMTSVKKYFYEHTVVLKIAEHVTNIAEQRKSHIENNMKM